MRSAEPSDSGGRAERPHRQYATRRLEIAGRRRTSRALKAARLSSFSADLLIITIIVFVIQLREKLCHGACFCELRALG